MGGIRRVRDHRRGLVSIFLAVAVLAGAMVMARAALSPVDPVDAAEVSDTPQPGGVHPPVPIEKSIPRRPFPTPVIAAETVDVDLEPGTPVKVGRSPIKIDGSKGKPNERGNAKIDVLPKADVDRLGGQVLAFRVEQTTPAAAKAGPVEVSVDYSSFEEAYGGDWSSRIGLVAVPECALATPRPPDCPNPVPVTTRNDLTTKQLVATLDLAATEATVAPKQAGLPAAAAPGSAGPAAPASGTTATTAAPAAPTATPTGAAAETVETTTTTTPGQTTATSGSAQVSGAAERTSTTAAAASTSTTAAGPTPTTPSPSTTAAGSAARTVAPAAVAQIGGGGVVLMVAGSPTGNGTGSWTATPLAASGKWQAGTNSGGFSWSYPVPAAPAVAGAAPSLSVNYSSQAIDGMNGETNSQGSWVGAGWSLDMGSIDRRYVACNDPRPGLGWGNPDQCWWAAGQTQNSLTISLNGRSSELVPATNPVVADRWVLRDDPGWLVDRKTGGKTGGTLDDNDGEYWEVRSPNGMKYTFGRGLEPTSNQDTNSVFTVPVYGLTAGDPCYNGAYRRTRGASKAGGGTWTGSRTRWAT